MDLKKILKIIKLHEQQISTFFGLLILIIAAIFVVKYINNLRSQSSIQQAASSTQNQNKVHSVTRGETLWSISQQYFNDGFQWKKIAEANNITNPGKLEVGQNLVIPEIQTETNISTSQSTTSQEPSPIPQLTPISAATGNTITGGSYTVVRGDNLWKIAVRAYGNGFKWVEIARANNLKNPSIIHNGNVFIIPR